MYGVAAATAVPGATEALFRLKQRPEDVALPVLCAAEAAASLGPGVAAVRRVAGGAAP